MYECTKNIEEWKYECVECTWLDLTAFTEIIEIKNIKCET